MRHLPTDTFANVARFLGARRLPDFKVERHNHQKGYRTDLCENKSLVTDLQNLLVDEYRAMELLLASNADGLPLPEELLLRQTRCDRPEEMQGASPEMRRAPLLVAE